jgi:hypothetical protein
MNETKTSPGRRTILVANGNDPPKCDAMPSTVTEHIPLQSTERAEGNRGGRQRTSQPEIRNPQFTLIDFDRL